MWFQRASDVVRKLRLGDVDLGIVGLDMFEVRALDKHEVASSMPTSRRISRPFGQGGRGREARQLRLGGVDLSTMSRACQEGPP